MHDTEWWCPEGKLDRLAMLYVPHEGDSFPYEELANASGHPPRILGGGGGLLSTAYDYDRFMNLMLLQRRRARRGSPRLQSHIRPHDRESFAQRR